MEKSKKNAVLFATIFSVLAVGTLLVFLAGSMLKPSGKEQASTATTSAKTAVQTASPTTGQTSSQPQTSQTKSKGGFFSFASSFMPATERLPDDMSAPTTGGQSSSGQPASTESLTYDQKIKSMQSQLDAAKTQAEQIQNTLNSSLLKGAISINAVYPNYNVGGEMVVLLTNDNLPKNTDITGLKLKSLTTGQTVEIGKGVALPLDNSSNQSADINLNPNDWIYVVTGSSPLGYSFKENKCTGYFNQFNSFYPSLSYRCPALTSESLPPLPNNINDNCLDYIQSFPVCRIHVSGPFSLDAPPQNDPYYAQTYECRNFVDSRTGYGNCLNLHRNDSDFNSNIWHVYLSRSQSIWKPRRETVQLLDKYNKVISQFSY